MEAFTVKVTWPLSSVRLALVEVGPVMVEVPPLGVSETARSETPTPAPSTIVTVMVEVVVPSASRVVGEATAVDSAGSMAMVVSVAEALVPSRVFSEVTGPVVLVRLWLAVVVSVVVVTTTLTKQEPEAGMVPPTRSSTDPPATVCGLPPPHVLVIKSGASFTTSAG